MRGLLLTIALAFAALPAAANGDPTSTLELELPGRVRDVQRVSGPGFDDLYLLSETTSADESEEDTWELRRVRLGAGEQQILGTLETDQRPKLELLIDADDQRLAVLADGALHVVGGDHAQLPPAVLSTDPGVELVVHDRSPWAAVADIGEVVLFDLGPVFEGGEPRELSRATTPVEADPRRSALELSSPPLSAVVRPGRGPAFAVGPQVLGNLRLRTQFVDETSQPGPLRAVGPEDSETEASETEGAEAVPVYWGMLPGVERLERSFFFEHDGRLVLGAVTLRADKQGILERKKLRLFDLERDRTRTGARPFFERLTASRMWQGLQVKLADYDGDGQRDLALLQPEGMGGGKLVLDLFAAEGSGFSERARRYVIKESEAWMSMSTDWTGDDIADVLVRAGNEVRAYSIAGRPAKRPLSKPDWSLAFPEAQRPEGLDEDDNPRWRVYSSAGALVLSTQYRGELDGDSDGEVVEGPVALRVVLAPTANG